tara:strand:- start:820 stop:1260 length:441 start_codon:yes stop_codon:yes gene_type:complete
MAGFVKNRNTNDGGIMLKAEQQAFTLPKGTTADRPGDLQPGEFRFNTDLGSLEYFDGSVFRTLPFQGNLTITQDSFTGDGTTTAFTMSKTVTSNQEQRILVSVGNVFQNPANAFTVSGTTLTFTSPPPGAEPITVIHGLDSNEATS